MGILTWIVIGVIALVIAGIGVQTFAMGLFNGAKKVADNPIVQNATGEAKQAVTDKVKEGISSIGK